MGINSVGYRAWDASPRRFIPAWWVIAATGVRRTSKSKWLQRILFLSLLPAFVLAVPFFLLEQGVRNPENASQAARLLRSMPPSGGVHLEVARNLDEATPEQIAELRHYVWSFLLLALFRYPQAALMVLAIGIAGPPLISHDMRSRASFIYFSRPIGRGAYLVGKLGTLAFFLAMITTLPALLLYLMGLLVSPSLAVANETWDLPLRILAASVALIVPTTSVALLFSSMTKESRYAAFAWFALWIVGRVAYGALTARVLHPTEDFQPSAWYLFVSPYHVLGIVQSWIFELEADPQLVGPAVAALAATSVASLVVVVYRISIPLRA